MLDYYKTQHTVRFVTSKSVCRMTAPDRESGLCILVTVCRRSLSLHPYTSKNTRLSEDLNMTHTSAEYCHPTLSRQCRKPRLLSHSVVMATNHVTPTRDLTSYSRPRLVVHLAIAKSLFPLGASHLPVAPRGGNYGSVVVRYHFGCGAKRHEYSYGALRHRICGRLVGRLLLSSGW